MAGVDKEITDDLGTLAQIALLQELEDVAQDMKTLDELKTEIHRLHVEKLRKHAAKLRA